MLFWVILAFLAGAYVGSKYPQQVQNYVESGKKLCNDLKNKISGKSGPSQPQAPTE